MRLAEAGARQHQDRNTPLYWKFRLLEAEALLAQGKREQAELLIASAVPARAGFDQLEVRRRIDLALANRASRDEALGLLEKAESQVTSPELRIQIRYLQGLFLYKGDVDKGEAKMREALELSTQRSADYYTALTLLNLAFFKKNKNQYSEALALGERSIALAKKIGADRITAVDLLNLGYLYGLFGDPDRALQYEEGAVHIFDAIGDTHNNVRALGETGLVLYTQGNAKESVTWYRKALDVAKGDFPDDRSRISSNLALAYQDLGEWNQAEQWNKLAHPQEGTNPWVLMNEAELALERGQRQKFFDLCNEVIQTATEPSLLWWVHADMARAYAASSDVKKALVEYRLALNVFEQARSQQTNEVLRITFLSRLIRLYQGYVETLVRDNRFEEALQVADSSRARVLADRFGGKPKMGPAAKAANTVLLSFWIAPERSFLWLISRDPPRRFDLPGEDKIADAVTEYKRKTEKQFKNPLSPDFGSASPLWSMLLEQAAPYIPPHSRVVVIPDGPLHQLNLETLVVPGTKPRYWLEDVEVVIAPSLSLAPSFARRAAAGNKMLLIGAADYTGTAYPRLAYAQEELNKIRARFPNPPPKLFEGREATPGAYLASQPAQFAMIHFAAHADANQQSPLESAVILSRSGDDYRLYAREIFKIPITADLVTISACRSAGTKAYAGEGLIGFAWAFLGAGARNVIGGLWQADDESTAELMSELYAGIAGGLDPVSALHRAKMKLLKDQPAPYYWAPFQVYAAR